MKKVLLLMVLVFGILVVGCGKDKKEDTNTSVGENISKNLSYEEQIMELATNEKYFKKINATDYFYPKYKELVCETYANRETPKDQTIKFCYETEEELKELKEYAKKFNETHERMKLSEDPFEDKHIKTISFANTFPNSNK